MEWRNHISSEDQRYIDQNHGTERFKQLVAAGWSSWACHSIKKGIPAEQHPQFDAAWRTTSRPDNPLHGIRDHVDDKISELLASVDNRAGAPAQKGLAWGDNKARELWQHIQSFFTRRQSAR